jgi:hypothetical protein
MRDTALTGFAATCRSSVQRQSGVPGAAHRVTQQEGVKKPRLSF